MHTTFKSLTHCYISTQPTNPNEIFNHFYRLLQKHTNNNLKQTQQIHAQIIHFNGLSHVFLPTKLISLYTKHNHLTSSRKVFENVPYDTLFNTIIWNSILRDNVTNNECYETIKIYKKMKFLGVLADGYSFPLVIRAFAKMGHFYLCDLVHCHVLVSGFRGFLDVGNELLAAYGRVGAMEFARKVFDEMCVRSCVSWNTMVSGFAWNWDCEGAREMVERMEGEGWEANDVTWTSLLSSYGRCGRYWETLRLYNVMRCKGVKASAESVSVVVSVCDDCDVFNKGRELHGYVVTVGFEDYSFAKNSLLGMYGKHGALEAAEKLFSEIGEKSLVSWNALISSYAQAGLCDEAFTAFLKLKNSEKYLVPNVVSWSAIKVDLLKKINRI